jgi:dihydroorotase
MKAVYANFRLVDADRDVDGTIVVENGVVKKIISGDGGHDLLSEIAGAEYFIDGTQIRQNSGPTYAREPLVILPSFIDLHAHFRDPGFPLKENLESASLAAVKGGYTTLVCMANTDPVLDTIAATSALKARSDTLGLIDLYPAMSLTKGMRGEELSEITAFEKEHRGLPRFPVRLISEDGKDLENDGLFLRALRIAARAGIPLSCHCSMGGENEATARALRLAKKAAAPVHIAHVSTKEAVAMIAQAKRERPGMITAEAMPHHFFLSEGRATVMGPQSHGKVAPPLRPKEDQAAVLEAVLDGSLDAVATDHAPHTEADKEAGAPGFSGLETAFAVTYTALVASEESDLCHLSGLLSAAPARILGLKDRGTLSVGKRADMVIVNPETANIVDRNTFRSRGKNTPFEGMELRGTVLATVFGGRTVYAV